MTIGYAHDPIKAKSREKIYDFAKSTLPKDRSQGTALYFASDNNEESQLIDKLGIPKENRIILEARKEKFRAVERANPGIKVLPINSHEFFEKEAEKYAPFLYCGLDYEGLLNERVNEDLRFISEKKLLQDQGFIYMNVSGMRENLEFKKKYLDLLFSNYKNLDYLKRIIGSNHKFSPELVDAWKSVQENHRIILEGKEPEYNEIDPKIKFSELILNELSPIYTGNNLKETREKAISATFLGLLLDKADESFVADLNALSVSGKFTNNELFNPVRNIIGNRSRNSILQIPFEEWFQSIIDANVSSDNRNLKKRIEENVLPYYKMSKLDFLIHTIKSLKVAGYITPHHHSISYTSNKNTNMFMDLAQVRSVNPEVIDIIAPLTRPKHYSVFYSSKSMFIGPTHLRFDLQNSKKNRKHLQNHCKSTMKSLEHKLDFLKFHDYSNKFKLIRENIGSSRRTILSEKKARECVLNDMSNEEIDQQFLVSDSRWKTISALRANKTKGKIVVPKEIPKKEVPKIHHNHIETPKEQMSKHIIPRSTYRSLPQKCQLRVDYFIDEVVDPLHHRAKDSVERSFTQSSLSSLIQPNIDPIRFYAFFDDVSLAIQRKQKITPDFLDSTYNRIKKATTLVEKVKHDLKPSPSLPQVKKKKVPSLKIKEEVRQLREEGFPAEDLWEEFKDNFESRQQFGAVIAWSSPKLKSKRNIEK